MIVTTIAIPAAAPATAVMWFDFEPDRGDSDLDVASTLLVVVVIAMDEKLVGAICATDKVQ